MLRGGVWGEAAGSAVEEVQSRNTWHAIKVRCAQIDRDTRGRTDFNRSTEMSRARPEE